MFVSTTAFGMISGDWLIQSSNPNPQFTVIFRVRPSFLLDVIVQTILWFWPAFQLQILETCAALTDSQV